MSLCPVVSICSSILDWVMIISIHLDVIVESTDGIGARMETWNYLFHILDKLITAYLDNQ
jgi:hypothetical protein